MNSRQSTGTCSPRKKTGYTDLEETARCGYILCDNLYRRIENAGNLGAAGIKAPSPPRGIFRRLRRSIFLKAPTPYSGFVWRFSDTHTRCGACSCCGHGRACGFCWQIYLRGQRVHSRGKTMIPELPEWYVIPQEVVRICQHIQRTTGTTQPMRNSPAARPRRNRKNGVRQGDCRRPAAPLYPYYLFGQHGDL